MKHQTVQQLRKLAGMTQHQLSIKSNVSVTEISDLENNRRNLTDNMADKLAPAFGMKARDLQYQHNVALIDEYVSANKSSAPGQLAARLREACNNLQLPEEIRQAAAKHLKNMTNDSAFCMKSLGRDSAGRYREEIAQEHAAETAATATKSSNPLQDFAAPGTIRDLHGRARKEKNIQRDLHGRRVK